MRRLLNRILPVFAAFSIALLAASSCEKDGPQGEGGDPLGISLTKTISSYKASSQFVTVTASKTWKLSLVYTGTATDWASLSVTSGEGTKKSIILGWEENSSEESRTCRIELTSGKETKSVEFTQDGKAVTTDEDTPAGINPDPVGAWMEIPRTQSGDGRYFFTHDMTVGSKKVRNYSFYLDTDAKISVWVAYPLNRGLIGSGSRTNDWGLDPKVPSQYQSVIYKAYKGGYERGHQIPSADRYAPGANEATFYGTNMTPQLGELNENAWANLEGYVRNWSSSFDTLYVVTGADIIGATETARDNDGKNITVPVGYFKALLGYKKKGGVGMTSQFQGYTAIGFYFKHEYYSDSQIMGQAMTIDALEAKTGFDFFPNLETAIGSDLAAKVESTRDSWWK